MDITVPVDHWIKIQEKKMRQVLRACKRTKNKL